MLPLNTIKEAARAEMQGQGEEQAPALLLLEKIRDAAKDRQIMPERGSGLIRIAENTFSLGLAA